MMLEREGYLEGRKRLIVCNEISTSSNPKFNREAQDYDDPVGISELLYLTISGSLIARLLLIDVGG
jgi:hypothetical protein